MDKLKDETFLNTRNEIRSTVFKSDMIWKKKIKMKTKWEVQIL